MAAMATSASKTPSTPPRAQSLSATALPYKKEHLIWEVGFARRFFLSLTVCAAVLLAAKHSQEAWLQGMVFQARLTGWLMWLSHRMEWWSVLGLLSSSCCVLQLLLNVFSFGCAGFNTWLGPLRPLMLAITVSLQASMWRVALTGRGERLLVSATGATALTAALSLLPELLHLYIHRHDASAKRGGAAAAAAAAGAEMCFRVEGMGCTACTAKVQRTVEALPGVAGCSVQLEGGEAVVRLDEVAAVDARMASALQRSVASALKEAGFPAACVGETFGETPTTKDALQ